MLFFVFYIIELISIRFVFVKLLLNRSTVVAASIYFRRELLRMLQLPTKIEHSCIHASILCPIVCTLYNTN
jgi:hypothetical protein